MIGQGDLRLLDDPVAQRLLRGHAELPVGPGVAEAFG